MNSISRIGFSFLFLRDLPQSPSHLFPQTFYTDFGPNQSCNQSPLHPPTKSRCPALLYGSHRVLQLANQGCPKKRSSASAPCQTARVSLKESAGDYWGRNRNLLWAISLTRTHPHRRHRAYTNPTSRYLNTTQDLSNLLTNSSIGLRKTPSSTSYSTDGGK
jgi:hypothetical protein